LKAQSYNEPTNSATAANNDNENIDNNEVSEILGSVDVMNVKKSSPFARRLMPSMKLARNVLNGEMD
jgi:hypothetical protein